MESDKSDSSQISCGSTSQANADASQTRYEAIRAMSEDRMSIFICVSCSSALYAPHRGFAGWDITA